MTMHMSKSDQGCGCGGGSDNCSCGGTDVCTDLNFKRPRFFAGQLLTEDDLQALTDYVVGKNRLHNRFLFGDGVVCGLAVTCDPCGGGNVFVAPGFALDCCGNDILVPCKEEIDVKALLRDLRKRQMAGYDCGDPCDEKDGGTETYGLYLTYTETMEDPVAPYASSDPCGQQACEPTRVCEGYGFELRCDCQTPDRPDVWQRIRACIGDLRQAGAAVAKAQVAQVQAERLLTVARAVEADTPVAFGKSSLAAIEKAPGELEAFNAIKIDGNGEADPKELPDERDVRLAIANLEIVTGALTRLRMTKKPDLDVDADALEKTADAARKAALDTAARIEVLGPRVLSTPAAREEAEAILRLSRRYLDEDLAEERLASSEARMMALGTPVSAAQISRLRIDASLLKDWLLDRLGNGHSLTRCDLDDRLRRIRIEPPGNAVSSDMSEARASAQAVVELLRILLEYLIDCICLALNPPCQPCETSGVLLACVKVKECEVVDICNMSRRHVLSPVAMRYWLPPVNAFGKLVERLCCDFDIGKLIRDPKPPKGEDQPPEFVSQPGFEAVANLPIMKSYISLPKAKEIDADTALVLERVGLTTAEAENVSVFAGNLALLSARSVFDVDAIAARGGAAGAVIRDRVAALTGLDLGALGRPEIAARPRPVGVAGEGSDAIEKRLGDRLDKTADSLRAEFSSAVEAKLDSQVEAEVTTQLTAARIRSAVSSNKTIKRLSDENKRLGEELDALTKMVAELKSGGG